MMPDSDEPMLRLMATLWNNEVIEDELEDDRYYRLLQLRTLLLIACQLTLIREHFNDSKFEESLP